MKNNIHIADNLKAAFIDYILDHFDDSVIIGHEVMYGSSGMFVDLILLYKGETYAIEVKSDADSLYRIDNQIKEYKKQFNYVIVVCGEKHLKTLRDKLPKGIGLYLFDNNAQITQIRKASSRTRLNKEEMLFSIKTSYLTKMADFPTTNMGPDAIRNKYAKKRISCIQETLYNYWASRLKTNYQNFMSERGSQTIPSDLSNFSSFRVEPAF